MEEKERKTDELQLKKEEIQKDLEEKFNRRKKNRPRQGRNAERRRNYGEQNDSGYHQEEVWGPSKGNDQSMANEEYYNDNGRGWGSRNAGNDTGWDDRQDSRGKLNRRDGYRGSRRGSSWRQRKNSADGSERAESVTSEHGTRAKKKYHEHDERWKDTADDQHKGKRGWGGNWGEDRGGYRRGDRRDHNRHYSGRENHGGWDDRENDREYGDKNSRGYGEKNSRGQFDKDNSKGYNDKENSRGHGGYNSRVYNHRKEPQPDRNQNCQGVRSRTTSNSGQGASPQPSGVWNERPGTTLFKKADPLGDLLPKDPNEEEVMLKKALEASKQSAMAEQKIRSLYSPADATHQEAVANSKVPDYEKFGKEYPDALGTKVWEDQVKSVHGKQTSNYGHNETQPLSSKETGSNASYFTSNDDSGWKNAKWSYDSNMWRSSHSGQPDAWQGSPAKRETENPWTPSTEKSSFPTSLNLEENEKIFPNLDNYVQSYLTSVNPAVNSDAKNQLTDLQLETTLNELIQEQQNNAESEKSRIYANEVPPAGVFGSTAKTETPNHDFQKIKASPEFGTSTYSFEKPSVKASGDRGQFQAAADNHRQVITGQNTVETSTPRYPQTASLGSNTNLVFTSSQKSMVSTSIQPPRESNPENQPTVFPEAFSGLNNQQKEATKTEAEQKGNEKSVLSEIMQFIQSSGQSLAKQKESECNDPETEKMQEEIRKKIEDMQIGDSLRQILSRGNDQASQDASQVRNTKVQETQPPQAGNDNMKMLNCMNQVPFPGLLVSGQPVPPFIPVMDSRGQIIQLLNPMLVQQQQQLAALQAQYMQAAKTALSPEEGRGEPIPMFPNPFCTAPMPPFIGIPNPSSGPTMLDTGAPVSAAESQQQQQQQPPLPQQQQQLPAAPVLENMQPTSMAGFQSPTLQAASASGLPQLAAMQSVTMAGFPSANMANLQSVNLAGLHSGGIQPPNLGNLQSANLGSLQSANLGGIQPASLGALQPTNLAGLQSVNMTTSLQSANVPAGVQSAALPSANAANTLQSANVASVLQSASIPSGLQSVNMSPGLHSAYLANLQSELQSSPSGPNEQHPRPTGLEQLAAMSRLESIAGLQPGGISSLQSVRGLQVNPQQSRFHAEQSTALSDVHSNSLHHTSVLASQSQDND